ncbi:WD40 repeat-like protein [Gymnopus androsaceus JB14]|uniref:Protein HIR n=1 Tax=Gymnopus androsaceus JB14 TaxID=1447944 RepID=A0A6A4HGY3_9AGAR|nr:WD40 repeat-like protein [Gymnopus androsaceus JB14]
MHFTKPAWVAHKDSSAKADSTKRLSIFSVHVHPDGSRIATGGLDAKVRIWSTKPILNPASEESNRPPKSLCTLAMHTVMIWDLDPNARGKAWGSDEINVEGWKPMKRLPGHESDVTDVAWAPEDRYLASVGLDSKVLIWCGFTLERLHKLDQHQGFVKGVCWDPVGEFLATQSDDRSVKIWRTSDWSLEAEVTKPFEDSPGSTFFRRLSWSPDGAHITSGFVFIAAVITRNSWTSDISLVGHENTVEVASYNPHIFLRTPSAPVATSNICSVVALGADDRSVSVWQTKSARPLIVAKEVFERQIMDLSWSWDGMTLYAASSDGTIAVFDFEPDELEGIAPHSVQEQYLSKFGFTPPPLPEGYSHLPPSHKVAGFDHSTSRDEVRNNKKRVGLTKMSSVPSAAAPSSFGGKRASFLPDPDVKMGGAGPTSPVSRESFFPTPDEQPFETHSNWKPHSDITMEDDSRPSREMVPVKEISDPTVSSLAAWRTGTSAGLDLPVEGTHIFEGLNPENGVQATKHFCAAAMSDGSLNVYSPSGRRLMSTLNLGSPASVMDGAKNCLLVVTQAGMLHSCDRWWSEGSDVWQGRQRSQAQTSTRGIVASAESCITAETPRPEWWTTAMTLGHLETRLHAARLVDSPAEYKQAKAEELIKELCGPIYWRHGEERDSSWSPTVVGLVKRDLLKDVLGQFRKTLQKLGQEWQDLLKKGSF